MLDPKKFIFCHEFYVVAKTVEVVINIRGESEQIRIEALCVPGSKACYSTRAYIMKDITVQPTFPQDTEGFTSKVQSVRVWVAYDLPWTAQNSADDALAQALSFLGERCTKS